MARRLGKGLAVLGVALIGLAFAQPAAASPVRVAVDTSLSCVEGGGAYATYTVTNIGEKTIYLRGITLSLDRVTTDGPVSVPVHHGTVGHQNAIQFFLDIFIYGQAMEPGETRTWQVPLGLPWPGETHPGADLSGLQLQLHTETWIGDSSLFDPDAVGVASWAYKDTFIFPGCNG